MLYRVLEGIYPGLAADTMRCALGLSKAPLSEILSQKLKVSPERALSFAGVINNRLNGLHCPCRIIQQAGITAEDVISAILEEDENIRTISRMALERAQKTGGGLEVLLSDAGPLGRGVPHMERADALITSLRLVVHAPLCFAAQSVSGQADIQAVIHSMGSEAAEA